MQTLARPNTTVIAGARSPDNAEALQQLKQSNADHLHIIDLDLSSTASIQVEFSFKLASSDHVALFLRPTTCQLPSLVCSFVLNDDAYCYSLLVLEIKIAI